MKVIERTVTGGGFVFRRITQAVSQSPNYLPEHAFPFDPGLVAGAWLDAPEALPAGSVVKDGSGLFQSVAWR
jgi:hypothetical protein